MKTLVLAATAACALLAAPAIASAQEAPTWYASVGYTNLNIDADDIDVNLGGIEGRVGVSVNKYLSFEGEAAIGIADDSVEVLGADVDVSMNWTFGAYAVVTLPVSEQFQVFGRLGYATTEFEAEYLGASESESANDYAVGVGAQAFFTANDGVRFDWTLRGEDATSWSIAYVRKF